MTRLFASAAAPTTVILPIPNERMLHVCWAACLVPIVAFCTGRKRFVTQHELCAAAGRRPTDGATTDDMAKALMRAAHIKTYPTPALSVESTVKLLANQQPIVLILDVGEGFHCVTLRGMVRDDTNAWHAVINEPNFNTDHSVFVPFARVHAAWRSGLIVAGRA